MICTLTTRKLRPGTSQEFASTFDSRVAELPPEIRDRWRHVYICRDVTDEDTVLSFGFFDGTIEELREVQAESHRNAMLSEVEDFIEEVLLDGSFEVIAEAQHEAPAARKRPEQGMHSSIWRFRGDPDELAARYDALMAEVPNDSMRMHACLKTSDGLLMFDTCPSREVFVDFVENGPFISMIESHGLPRPEIEDFPVHAAFVDGARRV